MMEALARTIREFGIVERPPSHEYVNRLARSHTAPPPVKSGIYLCYSHRDLLLSGAIAVFVGHGSKTDHIDDEPWRWVQSNLHELLVNYADEWIAVKNNAVVGHSKDVTALIKRLDKQGIQSPFITKMSQSTANATAYSINGD